MRQPRGIDRSRSAANPISHTVQRDRGNRNDCIGFVSHSIYQNPISLGCLDLPDSNSNPYESPNAEQQLSSTHESRQMATPHVRYVALAVVGVLLAPFTMGLSIAVALFVGPLFDRVAYAELTGTMPRDLPFWKVVATTFVTTIPLIIASFIAFFSVCGPAGGLVFAASEPLWIGGPGDPNYGLMGLVGGIILAGSTYLGLLLPFRLWRSWGRYDLDEINTSKDDEL